VITVLIKRPHDEPETAQITDTSELGDLVGGEWEIIHDDRLEGFRLVVNEEARGVQANNFPITSDGFLDWVYGTCVIVKADGSSLTDADVTLIRHYLAAK
jgi:hypothetical protein